jgi:hypothetical protein
MESKIYGVTIENTVILKKVQGLLNTTEEFLRITRLLQLGVNEQYSKKK